MVLRGASGRDGLAPPSITGNRRRGRRGCGRSRDWREKAQEGALSGFASAPRFPLQFRPARGPAPRFPPIPTTLTTSMKLKKTLAAGILALGLVSSSCLGPDNAYGSIKSWNAGLSDQDWVNELVFVGLYIIPVYEFALLGDILIFNTIGYWAGDNPINDPGPFEGFSAKD